jgi:hypothetical protein
MRIPTPTRSITVATTSKVMGYFIQLWCHELAFIVQRDTRSATAGESERELQ